MLNAKTKFLFGLFSLQLLAFSICNCAGQLTTTAFTRGILTNATAVQVRTNLGVLQVVAGSGISLATNGPDLTVTSSSSGTTTNYQHAVVTNNLTILQGAIIVGPSGGSITNILTGSANLDFGDCGGPCIAELTISVPGAGTNDVVQLGLPSNVHDPSYPVHFYAYTTADTVTVRFINPTAEAVNPPAGVFKVIVWKF